MRSLTTIVLSMFLAVLAGQIHSETISPEYLTNNAPESLQQEPIEHREADSRIAAQLGGKLSNIVFKDSYAYIGVGTRLLVLDITDPAHPEQVLWAASLQRPIEHLAIRDDILYLAGGTIRTFDISDPAAPHLLGSIQSSACRLAPNDPYIYPIGNCLGGIPNSTIIDARDPRHMTYHPKSLPYSHPHEDVALHTETGFATYNVFLQVWDTRDAGEPKKIHEIQHQQHFLDRLVLSPPHLIVSSNRGLLLYEIEQALAPRLLSTFDMDNAVSALAVTQDTIFATSDRGLAILEINQDSNIEQIAEVQLPASDEVSVHSGYAFVSHSQGLTVVNIHNPAQPAIESTLPFLTWANAIDLQGDLGFVALDTGGFAIVDLQEPANPQLLSQHAWDQRARYIAAHNNKLYLAGSSYLRESVSFVMHIAVFDLDSNPPRLIDEFSHPGKILDMHVSGQRVFVASPDSGLLVLNSEDGNQLELETRWNPEGFVPNTLFINGNQLQVLTLGPTDFEEPLTERLHIFDISSLPKLEAKGQLLINSHRDSGRMTMVGSDIYLPASKESRRTHFGQPFGEDIAIVDTSDPLSPTIKAFSPLQTVPWDLQVMNDTAYIAAGVEAFRFSPQGRESLIILPNIGATTSPGSERWDVTLPNIPLSLAIHNEHAILAVQNAGLQIVDVRPEALSRPTATPIPTLIPPPTRTREAGAPTETPLPTRSLPTSTAILPPDFPPPAGPWQCWLPFVR